MDKKESHTGGWLSSWIQAAKEKSESLFEVVGADLAEFSDVMRGDVGKMATSMMKAMQEKEEKDQKTQSTSSDKITTSMLNRTEAELKNLQSNTETYESDPFHEDFTSWRESFNLDSHKLEISNMLANNPNVRGIFTQLVPKRVSNVDFWTRYFFQQKLLQNESARRMELLKRAEKDDDEIGWDEDEEESTDDEESTEKDESSQKTTETTHKISTELAQKTEETTTTPTTTINNDTQQATDVEVKNEDDAGENKKDDDDDTKIDDDDSADKTKKEDKNEKTHEGSDDESDGHSEEWVKDFEGDLTGFKVSLPESTNGKEVDCTNDDGGDKKVSNDSDKKPDDWEEW